MSEQKPPAELGVLRISGPDARRFLQGQLSNDLRKLETARPLLAGLHNPQGRVLALLRLWPAPDDPDAVLALLPAELSADTGAHLRRFVMRSRVVIAEDDASWPAWDARRVDDVQEVAAGLPEVYRATRGEFVAQMLNLDCVGAIAWDKGCYTGQEIIARAHYRGQVKRRMRRFAVDAGELPLPGAIHRTRDGLEVRVVRSARRAGGEGELLGVAPLDQASVDERPLPYAWPGH